MQLFRTLTFLVYFGIVSQAFAQVRIHGNITCYDEVLPNAIIEKYINGKRSVDILANNKGKYSVDLPLNVRAELVIKYENKLPVKFIVDTYPKSKSHSNSKEYDVPFDVDLFDYFSSIELKFDPKTAFGEILMDGVGSETFSFHPNDVMIKHLLQYKEASKAAMRRGENASNYNLEESVKTETTPPKSLDQIKAQQAQSANSKVQQTAVLKGESINKIAEAKENEIANKQAKATTAEKQNEKSDFERKDIQTQNKQTKAEVYTDESRLRDSVIEMRANKNMNAEEMAAAGGVVNEGVKKASTSYKIIKQAITKQTFYTDDVLIYEANGRQFTLLHTTYDWMLFTSDYYYLNGEEISEEKYEIEKKKVLP